MRESLYWDAFSKRIKLTVDAIKCGELPEVSRCAVFITDACNFTCDYCNKANEPKTMSETMFHKICEVNKDAIIHITGGEPSIVKWLYPFLEANADKYSFHLNTNAYIKAPKGVKRLKVSLDSCNPEYWNKVVGVEGAWDVVVKNIKEACHESVTSITYTLSKENFRDAPDFIDFSNAEFEGLYALFFSIYKGDNPRFAFTEEDIEEFFNDILPIMHEKLPPESLALLNETLDEKRRLIAGERFPQNSMESPCYLSMSERVYATSGEMYKCSHLFRDGIGQKDYEKHEKCKYGCNRRLVAFNEEVDKQLSK